MKIASSRPPSAHRTLRTLPAALLLLAAFGPALPFAYGQFTSEEIARRGSDEEFLAKAQVIRSVEIGEGVTKPYKLYLKLGDREDNAVWKNPSGMQFGYLDSWKYEIAAYRMDKLIGLNMVPPAAERGFKGKQGCVILWIKNRFSLLKMVETGVSIPPEALEKTNRMKWLARAWDSLIANEDRTQQNVLYTDDWRTILIDHSRSFRSTPGFTSRLMYGRDGIKTSATGSSWLFRSLPRRFVEALKTLTEPMISQEVGDCLSKREIKAILIRRDLLLREIRSMIAESGEAAVIYDE